MKHRLEKLTINSSTWYYIIPWTENTHLTPDTCPKTPHSQLIYHLRRSTEITAVEFFNSSSLSIHNKLNDQVIFLLTNPGFRLVTNLLVAHVLVRESWLNHFIRTMDIWECSMSQKKSALVHKTLLFCNAGRLGCEQFIRRNRIIKQNNKIMKHKENIMRCENVPVVMKEWSRCRSLVQRWLPWACGARRRRCARAEAHAP